MQDNAQYTEPLPDSTVPEIRSGEPADREAIRNVNREAFWGEGEAERVDLLRADPRFGFVPARPAGIELPLPAPGDAFRMYESIPDALSGIRVVFRFPDALDQVCE